MAFILVLPKNVIGEDLIAIVNFNAPDGFLCLSFFINSSHENIEHGIWAPTIEKYFIFF